MKLFKTTIVLWSKQPPSRERIEKALAAESQTSEAYMDDLSVEERDPCCVSTRVLLGLNIYPQSSYVLVRPVEFPYANYWSKEDGWVAYEKATRFSQDDVDEFERISGPALLNKAGWRWQKVDK